MEVAECKPYEIFWYQWSIYESVVVCIGGVSVQTDGVWPYEFFFEVLKCPPPLQCHVFCSIITYIRYIILWAPLHVCAGSSHHQTLFWDRCVSNDWLSDWYSVYRAFDQGCGLFLPTEYAYVGVFYVLMHVHPCYYYHWFMYFSTLLLFSISPMYLIQDISGLLCMFV